MALGLGGSLRNFAWTRQPHSGNRLAIKMIFSATSECPAASQDQPSSPMPVLAASTEEHARRLEEAVWAYYNYQHAREIKAKKEAQEGHSNFDASRVNALALRTFDKTILVNTSGCDSTLSTAAASSKHSPLASPFYSPLTSPFSSSVGPIVATSVLVASTATATGLLYAFAKGRGKG